MAKKLFTNLTSSDLEITLHIRAGDMPDKNAGTVSFTVEANDSEWMTYGDEVNIYLNGITLAASDGSIEKTFLTIERATELDDRLNRRNNIQITCQQGSYNFVGKNVLTLEPGCNEAGDPAQGNAGEKLFSNLTHHDLNITLYIREGDLPKNTAGTLTFALASDEAQLITYGDATNIYLNGIEIDSANGTIEKILITLERGNQLDTLLNTNNTIEISLREGSFNVYGKNPFDLQIKDPKFPKVVSL